MQSKLEIVCSCGNKSILKYIDQGDIPISDVHEIFQRLVCSKCSEKRKFKIYDDDKLILDSQNFKSCEVCLLPILIPRLEALPDTLRCTSCTYKNPSGYRLSRNRTSWRYE